MAFTSSIVPLLFALLSYGPRELGPVENIHGIPYPKPAEGQILITEPLAHTDIYLPEPVLAKELILDLTYRPINLKSLAVGVREDSFWLSYGSKQEIFSTDIPHSTFHIQNSTITIPLTDKLPDHDGSVDLMFFAESDGDPLWELHEIKARVQYATPTYPQFKNYIRSILTREKVL